ncbi:MAG: MBOAT family O-acyltransferase [Leptospiraceae bacterium]|nr:MBOAT family O-acyltransferase [Leptospiraceae bacterium]
MKSLSLRILVFFLSFFLTLGIFNLVQVFYLDNLSLSLFPKFNQYLESREKIENDVQQETAKTPFLKIGLETGIESFFHRLDLLEKNKVNEVKILHFGDSIIWGDILTEELQKNFQKNFGDGGRGLVPPFYRLERTLKNHFIRNSEQGIENYRVKPWAAQDANLGFLGEANILKTAINHEVPEDKNNISKIKLIFRSRDTIEFQTTLKTEKESLVQIHKPNKKCFSVSLDLNETRKFQLQISEINGKSPFLDAINITSSNGITYSPIARMGIEMKDLLSVSEENFQCGLQEFSPDLIVLQFGINESQNLYQTSRKDIQIYKKEMKEFISRIKKILPKTSILIISPTERIRMLNNGEYGTMPELVLIHSAMKEISIEEKIGFYDSIQALGGIGRSKILFEKGIIQEDRTHLTRLGGEVLGKKIFQDIDYEYRTYLGELDKRAEIQKLELKDKNNQPFNFNSEAYFIFLGIVFILQRTFAFIPYLRLILLLSFSYYFYISWNFKAVGLILFSTVLDYFIALLINSERLKGRKGSIYLWISLLLNLGLLFYFKYFHFTIELLNSIKINGEYLSIPIENLDILLPVGISFYTFQTLSYTIDVYRGVLTPERNFLKFALFVSFFPQLVAGPIVRAKDFLVRFKDKVEHFSLTKNFFSQGIFLILSGLLKKNLADLIGQLTVNKVFSSTEMFSSTEVLLGIYGFAFQIYGDFSGYTDIALGSAMILGFRLTKNFDRPYQSSSITEFWRRWHISLGSWFRDYLYIPLGGNQNQAFRNLFITMFLCGLWHGASVNFILWGIYHGLFLFLERWFTKHIMIDNQNSLYRFCKIFFTFHLVLIGWILFRTKDLAETKNIFFKIQLLDFSTTNLSYLGLVAILIMAILHFTPRYYQKFIQYHWLKLGMASKGFLSASFTIALFHIKPNEIQSFIYFQF